MATSPQQFYELLNSPEGTHLEFKSARQQYDFDKLVDYCVALANEGGGKIILGVTDKRPRDVVGTRAFDEPGETEARLHQILRHRIPIEEYFHDQTRVLVVHVPARLPGDAWQHDGKFLKRAGDALVPMDHIELKEIFAETGPDFSAQPCEGLTLEELSSAAIQEFRKRWMRRSPTLRLETKTDWELLEAAELTSGENLNFAALILLGSRATVSKYLAQAEVVFEYRSAEAAGPAQDRQEFREGFLLVHEILWQRINLRNDRQSYQDDFFRYDIPTFDEVAIREGILNAICHRDYKHGGSIFIRQYSRRLEIVNPGGFPPGITTENIADQQNPRNRRLAEVLQRCGFIERSGQGVNLMIENAIRQTKPLPDFSRSDNHEVRLTLAGTVQDPAFIRFIEHLGEDQLQTFNTLDFLTLDALARGAQLNDAMRGRLPRLVDLGAVESQGRGRGIRFFLSRELYAEMGSPGTYTRQKGLDHETNKALLEKHLHDRRSEGAQLGELCQVLPACSPKAVQRLLNEMRNEGRVALDGTRRWARWFASAFDPTRSQ